MTTCGGPCRPERLRDAAVCPQGPSPPESGKPVIKWAKTWADGTGGFGGADCVRASTSWWACPLGGAGWALGSFRPGETWHFKGSSAAPHCGASQRHGVSELSLRGSPALQGSLPSPHGAGIASRQTHRQTDRQKRSPESRGWWTETHCIWPWGGKQGQGGHGWGVRNSEWERLWININRPPEDACAARLPCELMAGSPASPGAYSAVFPAAQAAPAGGRPPVSPAPG